MSGSAKVTAAITSRGTIRWMMRAAADVGCDPTMAGTTIIGRWPLL